MKKLYRDVCGEVLTYLGNVAFEKLGTFGCLWGKGGGGRDEVEGKVQWEKWRRENIGWCLGNNLLDRGGARSNKQAGRCGL
jgi:hypothetical protein